MCPLPPSRRLFFLRLLICGLISWLFCVVVTVFHSHSGLSLVRWSFEYHCGLAQMADKSQSPFSRLQSFFQPSSESRAAQAQPPHPTPNSHDTPDPDDGHAGAAAPAPALAVTSGSLSVVGAVQPREGRAGESARRCGRPRRGFRAAGAAVRPVKTAL